MLLVSVIIRYSNDYLMQTTQAVAVLNIVTISFEIIKLECWCFSFMPLNGIQMKPNRIMECLFSLFTF